LKGCGDAACVSAIAINANPAAMNHDRLSAQIAGAFDAKSSRQRRICRQTTTHDHKV
jgi:hypothetical protein